jgi:serine protease Do
MKNRLLFVALILLVATVACGGGGTAPQEDTSTDVQPAGGSLDFTQDPNFGGVELAAGFTPDPQMVSITSGGAVDVDTLGLGGGCTGYATSAPDFRILFTGPSNNLRIFFVSDGGEDATLIVNDPSGAWLCNDDAPSGGWDPQVDVQNASDGQYDIWVGSYSSGEFIAGTLYITELNYTPINLP